MHCIDSRSVRTYIVLVSILIAVKTLFLVFPAQFPLEDQASALSWTAVLAIAMMGVIGLYAAPHAGFPSMWDERVPNTKRFGLPVLDDLVYGLITVMTDLGHPVDVHMRFPQSIPFYTFGGIFLEILLRLFALTVLTWLIGRVVLFGKSWSVAFWIANVVTSLYEPWPFMMRRLATATTLEAPEIVVDSILSPLFIGNLLTGTRLMTSRL